MFRIITPNGVSVLTEDPKWIRVHEKNPNCFLLCKREKADGIAYKGNPFLFKDGVMCHEVDSGDEFAAVDVRMTNHDERLVQADEMAIELYEANMVQDEVIAAQDDALIELYEMIGGN